jgi:hypothetical protein
LATAEELNNVTGMYFNEKKDSVNLPGFAKEAKNKEAVMRMTKDYLK